MRQSSWKFFVGIGILLIIAGAYVYPLDDIVGIIGVLFGVYNVYKGIQLARGKQPYLIRKQEESLQRNKEKLQKQLNQSDKDKNKDK